MNDNSSSNKKKKKNETTQFEFCTVCRINHNQGRRHNFFPKHQTSLSTLLTRFQSDISPIKPYLKSPVSFRPENAETSRLWCVFCDIDVVQLNSSYVCGDVIEHLVSLEHRKKVKRFLWKYGGGVDRVELFCVSDVDFAKWEKKCKSFKIEAAKEESAGQLKNIHNELNADYVNVFYENSVNFRNINTSNSVLPLQSYTNEQALASSSVLSSVPESSSSWQNMYGATKLGEAKCINTSTGWMNNYPLISVPRDFSSSVYHCNGPLYIFLPLLPKWKDLLSRGSTVNPGAKTAIGENAYQGISNLTQISSTSREPIEGNIHTGALPPWLSAPERNPLETTQKPGQSKILPPKAVKSSKLNPKRVGAAWAERRALELELERRGEHTTKGIDANWLPNFGRVWQSGTRKESRKEFQSERKSSLEVDDKPEEVMPLQPYVSKRMRTDTSN